MKSKRAEFFDDAVVSGPDQKAFEEKIYAEAQAKWNEVLKYTSQSEWAYNCLLYTSRCV